MYFAGELCSKYASKSLPFPDKIPVPSLKYIENTAILHGLFLSETSHEALEGLLYVTCVTGMG